MLEEQNQFLENEFQQQLERVSTDKNEQISRLTQIVDRQCASQGRVENDERLRQEVETLRCRLEQTCARQVTLETMQQSELEIRELRSKLSCKEDENQALIHLVIVRLSAGFHRAGDLIV